MSPLDRISQLSEELSKLRDINLILQSQIADAREQAKRDSEIITRLAADKRELVSTLPDVEFLLRKIGINWREAGSMTDSCSRASKEITALLSRHA